jgi:hypothetical protein
MTDFTATPGTHAPLRAGAPAVLAPAGPLTVTGTARVAGVTLDQVKAAAAGLRSVPDDVQRVVAELNTALEGWQKSRSYSDEWKAEKTRDLRAAADAKLVDLQKRAQDRIAVINSYQPQLPGADLEIVREQQVARGWGRALSMLEAGMTPIQILRQAVADQDAPMLQALREEMPARLMRPATFDDGGRLGNSIADRQIAASDFRALVDKGVALAFPDSDLGQAWLLAIGDTQPLAELASIALMQGRSTARDEVWGLDGMELAIRIQAAKRVIDQRTVLRDKVRSMSSVDLATSYL